MKPLRSVLQRGLAPALVLGVLSACAGPFVPGPTPIPTSAVPLTEAQLKYRLIDSQGELFFCDPDFYPVGRADEADLARQRFPEIQAQMEEFDAILVHLGLAERARAGFTNEEVLVIYREHKQLAAVTLEPMGSGYRFQMRVSQGEMKALALEGEIDRFGAIRVTASTLGEAMCPICLAESAGIETPSGRIPVSDIRPGDLVWSLTADGGRVAMRVLRVGSTPVPAGHVMIRVSLADGRVALASPGHPTPGGARMADLRVGDSLGGSTVMRVERVIYPGAATYDLLPEGETGVYWADGVLLASTLQP